MIPRWRCDPRCSCRGWQEVATRVRSSRSSGWRLAWRMHGPRGSKWWKFNPLEPRGASHRRPAFEAVRRGRCPSSVRHSIRFELRNARPTGSPPARRLPARCSGRGGLLHSTRRRNARSRRPGGGLARRAGFPHRLPRRWTGCGGRVVGSGSGSGSRGSTCGDNREVPDTRAP